MSHQEVTASSARLQAMSENWATISRRPMRSASVTLPDVSSKAIVWLERNLVTNFGGFTVTYGDGKWQDPDTSTTHTDSVNTYTVAMENTFKNNTTFRALSRIAGVLAKQLSVMVMFADGNVEMIEIDSAEANGRRQLLREAAND